MDKSPYSSTGVEFPIRIDQKPTNHRHYKRNHSCDTHALAHTHTSRTRHYTDLEISRLFRTFAPMEQLILGIIAIVLGAILHRYTRRHMP